MTVAYCRRLAGEQPRITELLSRPAGVEDIEFELPVDREPAEPARFD